MLGLITNIGGEPDVVETGILVVVVVNTLPKTVTYLLFVAFTPLLQSSNKLPSGYGLLVLVGIEGFAPTIQLFWLAVVVCVIEIAIPISSGPCARIANGLDGSEDLELPVIPLK